MSSSSESSAGQTLRWAKLLDLEAMQGGQDSPRGWGEVVRTPKWEPQQGDRGSPGGTEGLASALRRQILDDTTYLLQIILEFRTRSGDQVRGYQEASGGQKLGLRESSWLVNQPGGQKLGAGGLGGRRQNPRGRCCHSRTTLSSPRVVSALFDAYLCGWS